MRIPDSRNINIPWGNPYERSTIKLGRMSPPFFLRKVPSTLSSPIIKSDKGCKKMVFGRNLEETIRRIIVFSVWRFPASLTSNVHFSVARCENRQRRTFAKMG